MSGDFLNQAKLHEFYMINIDKTIEEFQSRITGQVPTMSQPCSEDHVNDLNVILDPHFRRNSCTIDMNLAMRLYNSSW